ncbi:hypothetical protein EPVG_00187 [Emiliania huxleyi virus 201]|nr:hypothetical protein ELVG_00115 [Emiliania huxleyi virus 203]AEP15522.1 hypothetical protein EQVG_00112 [Emiliania huxleyi virus 207]AEP15944.1 hypothetical protein ERVG_00066 [Emiliania huxleyi virus 208]AET98074.1 hypothetical protein EPVG_00187 [Emiliania huxleyi virus 201]
MIKSLIVVGVAVVLIIVTATQNTKSSIGVSIITSSLLLAYIVGIVYDSAYDTPTSLGNVAPMAAPPDPVRRSSSTSDFLHSLPLPTTDPGEHTPTGKRLTPRRRRKIMRSIKSAAKEHTALLSKSPEIQSIARESGITPKQVLHRMTSYMPSLPSARTTGAVTLGMLTAGAVHHLNGHGNSQSVATGGSTLGPFMSAANHSNIPRVVMQEPQFSHRNMPQYVRSQGLFG